MKNLNESIGRITCTRSRLFTQVVLAKKSDDLRSSMSTSGLFATVEKKRPLCNPGDSTLSDFDRRDFPVSQGFDIAHCWLAEETAVLPAELAYALVADFVRRARGINPVHEHALSCCLQLELLLVLERAHCRQSTELMVER